MTIHQITQGIENKFWNLITPLMTDEGVLMKAIRATKQGVQDKRINIILLIFIWAAIGFVSGMLIGRVITILQIM